MSRNFSYPNNSAHRSYQDQNGYYDESYYQYNPYEYNNESYASQSSHYSYAYQPQEFQYTYVPNSEQQQYGYPENGASRAPHNQEKRNQAYKGARPKENNFYHTRARKSQGSYGHGNQYQSRNGMHNNTSASSDSFSQYETVTYENRGRSYGQLHSRRGANHRGSQKVYANNETRNSFSSEFSGNHKLVPKHGNKKRGMHNQSNVRKPHEFANENASQYNAKENEYPSKKRSVKKTKNAYPFRESKVEKSSDNSIEPTNVAQISMKFDTVLKVSEDDKTQRDRMIELLGKGKYECMVCVGVIKQTQPIWTCQNCYNSFHLRCIKKWAVTSKDENGWRCPACQNVDAKVPSAYMCFCKKVREPGWNRRECAHSCGEICGKKRGPEWCTHNCNILCHPGPCPPCTAFIQRSCACGQTEKGVRCSQTDQFICDNVCSKLLDCGFHKCSKKCHTGDCDSCVEKLKAECYCGKKEVEMDCSKEAHQAKDFSCEEPCGKVLDCLLHYCEDLCHEGPCKPCERTVSAVTTCPCGKVPLQQLYDDGCDVRKTCEDPIPTCKNLCEKRLKCGVPGDFHLCQAKCHDGPCPVCPRKTPVRCRCGAVDRKIECKDLHVKADEVTCEKQCKKMRKCGRHKCGRKCCIDIEHQCDRTCGKMLSCGLHRCEDPCHRGNCSRCWQSSFDELSCHCGASVIYPPVDCGTAPPSCDKPCRRERNCDHGFTHTCHEGSCPPCTVLVSKKCCGGHMEMKSTPCYVSSLSCGKLCLKDLPCGMHKCQKICHEGACQTQKKCSQKCSKPRGSCGHPCNSPCHQNNCPVTPCKVNVQISCRCGNRKMMVPCSENEREYTALTMSKLANTMQQNLSSCGSVNISQIFSSGAGSEKYKRLDCDDDCKKIERNNRLAMALQIQNPETRDRLGDSASLYSDQLKDDAKKDIQFATMVHDTLHSLVMRAKESKHKNRSYSFPPMNREKRRFIHEYCKHFFCESQAYDEEPKKNVVVTAQKGTCCLPPVSIVDMIQNSGGRKMVPLLNKDPIKTADDRQLKVLEKSSSFEKNEELVKEPPPKRFDYFDME